MPAEHQEASEIPASRLWLFPPMRNAIAAGLLLAAGFATGSLTDVPEWSLLFFYVPAIALGASHWGPEVLEALRELRINIDVLMGVATAGAAVLGLWEEAAFLAFLYGAAEALEEYAYERTTGAIRALLDLTPKEAHLLTDGKESLIPAADLKKGDRFSVRPGESMPTDGLVESGMTTVDESPITGESVPVEKTPGSSVFAGTINHTGAITVTATRDFQDNTISRIIELVGEAQEEKTQIQRRIDRFGSWYSPAVLGAALLLWLLPPLFGGDFRLWSERAITLAVAGAPCALVMSTPVAVAAAIGRAGKRGVLIKGGAFLERLAVIDTLALDKTGTLTLGKPSVTAVVPLDGATQESVVSAAASVERYSEHPLALAVRNYADERGVAVADATGFSALPGRGATAAVNGSSIYVGNRKLLIEKDVDASTAEETLKQFESQGQTVVLVADGHKPLGVIAVSDVIRPESREAVEEIRRSGVENLVMISGDNRSVAERVATEVGIEEVHAGISPEGKLQILDRMKSEGRKVAMIGDGINDAPALAAADVGIAMGVAGTDAAIESADVALMGDDLRSVAFAIHTSHRVAGISRQNLIFSSLLLAALLPLAATGVIGVAAAVLVHEVSELLAVGNGLRVWKG